MTKWVTAIIVTLLATTVGLLIAILVRLPQGVTTDDVEYLRLRVSEIASVTGQMRDQLWGVSDAGHASFDYMVACAHGREVTFIMVSRYPPDDHRTHICRAVEGWLESPSRPPRERPPKSP